MSEEVQVTTPPPSRAELIAAASAAADAEPDTEADTETPSEDVSAEPAKAEVLSVEDISGDKTPESITPGLREFLREQKGPAEPTALEREIADLKGALDGLAAPATQQEESTENQMLAKLEALEARFVERDAADAKAAEEEAYNNRVRTLREGMEANLKAKEKDYPGLVALGQFDTVFNEYASREQAFLENRGAPEPSDDEVASEVESGLREVYNTLHKVYGTPSKDSTPVSERKQTLTPGLASTEEPSEVDTSKMSRSEYQEYVWNKTNS